MPTRTTQSPAKHSQLLQGLRETSPCAYRRILPPIDTRYDSTGRSRARRGFLLEIPLSFPAPLARAQTQAHLDGAEEAGDASAHTKARCLLNHHTPAQSLCITPLRRRRQRRKGRTPNCISCCLDDRNRPRWAPQTRCETLARCHPRLLNALSRVSSKSRERVRGQVEASQHPVSVVADQDRRGIRRERQRRGLPEP